MFYPCIIPADVVLHSACRVNQETVKPKDSNVVENLLILETPSIHVNKTARYSVEDATVYKNRHILLYNSIDLHVRYKKSDQCLLTNQNPELYSTKAKGNVKADEMRQECQKSPSVVWVS